MEMKSCSRLIRGVVGKQSLLKTHTSLHSCSIFLPSTNLKKHSSSKKKYLEEEMGNCQAIDSATLVIQHPNGKVDNLYWPVAASEIMKMNPGHYVALLLTTTLYSSTAAAKKSSAIVNNSNTPLRITRIKLLRPTDTLVLGHAYRLVTSQEVMKGMWAKKQAKMKQQQVEGADKHGKIMTEKISPDFEEEIRRSTEMEKTKQVKHERQRSRNNTAVNSGVSKPRGWQPSLKAISEAGS